MRETISTEDLKAATTNQVNYLTESGLMFTAHDVTKLVRKSNPTKEINHVDVRFIVRDMYPDDFPVGYTRTLKDNNPNGPFIYHEIEDDVTLYDKFYRAYGAGVTIDDSIINPVSDYPIGITAGTKAGLPSTFQLGPNGTVMTTDPSTGKFTPQTSLTSKGDKLPLDKLGRIRIPKSYTESIGLSCFDAVNVKKEGCCLKISKITDKEAPNWYAARKDKVWTHSVDLYGNIRISLKPYNIASSNTVLIESNNKDTLKIWP